MVVVIMDSTKDQKVSKISFISHDAMLALPPHVVKLVICSLCANTNTFWQSYDLEALANILLYLLLSNKVSEISAITFDP